MAKPTAQQCHALTTYYTKKYTEKYKVAPTVNRNTARWSFESLLMDMPSDEVKELIDFYLKTTSLRRHPLDWFFYNYEKLIEEQQESKRDKQERERIMRESAERVREWRARGMKSIETEREK